MSIIKKIKNVICTLTITALLAAIPSPVSTAEASVIFMNPTEVQEMMYPVEETKVPTIEERIIDDYIDEQYLYGICVVVGDMYDIEPELLLAIAKVESSLKVHAVSHCNAKGLCQVIPKYHKERMERLGISDIFDPYSNVLLCADILDNYRDCKYRNDVNWMLMAYNMGPNAALGPYERGEISGYAKKVMNTYHELGGRKL